MFSLHHKLDTAPHGFQPRLYRFFPCDKYQTRLITPYFSLLYPVFGQEERVRMLAGITRIGSAQGQPSFGNASPGSVHNHPGTRPLFRNLYFYFLALLSLWIVGFHVEENVGLIKQYIAWKFTHLNSDTRQ
jgi:hypothetical protein